MSPELHEPTDRPGPQFQAGRLYSLLDILGGGHLTCDLCGRWQRFAAGTSTGAREYLKLRGWTFANGKDICPKCSVPPPPVAA